MAKVLCAALLPLLISVCKRHRGKTKRACWVESKALLLARIEAQITNLGAVIVASRCWFNHTFVANHPVMISLIANAGSDGR